MALHLPLEYAQAAYSDGHPFAVDMAHLGQGNWRAFRALGISLDEVFEIARGWRPKLDHVRRPWLCWNVDEDWCLVQQRLVWSVGWTPVIGFDPRVGPPRQTVPGAVIIDFNEHLGLPLLYPHFPLEFAFLFAEKLAFWHSDLLVRHAELVRIAAVFNACPDGRTVATSAGRPWMRALSNRRWRYWELVGCTTKSASRSQFDNGCGWWMDYWAHPKQLHGEWIKPRFYWDHGSGIYYWHRYAGGNCEILDERRLSEGHFTKMRLKDFKRYRESTGLSDARRSMADEMGANFELAAACKSLGLEEYCS